MRQTKNSLGVNIGRLLLLAGAVLFFSLLSSGSAWAQTSPNSAFQDLPKDHWAFGDVDFLIKQGFMEGYPDGTFKGRKVVTRYDVALILARILKRLQDKKEATNDSTEMERAALARLTKEFRDELGLLGVRVDAIERRLTETESKVKSIEDVLPKVKVSGFYRGRGQMILEPSTVNRNEAGDKESFTKPGLVTFYQTMYLRFTGKPLGDKIETFYELIGYIQGYNWNKLVYNDTGKTTGPNPFDRVDDYISAINYDRYAQSNKMHFVSNARSAKVRVFANESITGINDPLNMVTEDTDVVQPYQGIEISGSDQGVTYQGGAYKNDIRWGAYGNTHEILDGRLVWKLPAKFSPDALSLGTSYAEKIADYKIRGNSNTVRGVDINYTTERIGKVQATAEFLNTTDYHKDTTDGKSRNLGDQGTKFDASFQQGGFTGTMKHYDFGLDFRAMMAPIWAYDVGDEGSKHNWPLYITNANYPDNYGHVGFHGEKLTRWSANYDFGNKLLSIAKNLSMESTWLSKTWEVDPFAPQPTDGYSGRKFTYQVLADFTDSTTLKYDFEQKFKAFADSRGRYANTFELNLKLDDAVSTLGKINVVSDRDERDKKGEEEFERSDRTGFFEVNSNINPRVFAKGSVEHQVRWVNAPKENTRIDYIGEVTYNFTPTTSLTGGVQHIDFENLGVAGNPSLDDTGAVGKSSLTNAILAELKKNFTDKFRGRAFYSRAVIDYKNGDKDTLDRENIYGELIYDISKDASFKLKFGYDYPKDGRWDVSSIGNGRDFKEIHTQKMMIFEAKTNF